MAVHVEVLGADGVDAPDVITVLTIDRPERRNALDRATLDELIAALDDAAARPTRALVLTGAGGHFCAGADLKTVEDASYTVALQGFLDRLCGVPFPTIAAVEGAALGAGSQLAVACDLRVAQPDATFGVPAAKLGLMVNHWTVRRVSRLVGPSTARAVFLACENLSGADALRLGLVNRPGARAEAVEWASAISLLAPLTVAGHKLMLNRVEADLVPDPDVAAAFERAWASADFAEGVAAFNERRRPNFTGA